MDETDTAKRPATADPTFGSRRAPAMQWRPYGVALLLALAAAVLVAGQTYLSMLHHGHSWWRLVLWQFLSWTFWALLAPSLLGAGAHPERLGLRRSGFIAMHLFAALGLTLVHQLLAAGITTWLQPFEPVEQMGFRRALDYLSVPWAFVDLAVYWLLIALGYGLATARRRRELELRESRLETELARAQLQALRLELQPHFLFNTLNSVAALVRKRRNEQALEMILGLSHLLRLTLDRSDRQLVPLSDEVSFVRRYVELQRQRFADRLRVTYEVDPQCDALEVPTLLLQPLVENAIRHGIANRPSGGSIELRVDRVPEGLRIRVIDDGPGPPADFELERSSGVGLGRTRSRLAQLYGEAARIRLTRLERGGALAEVVLPVSDPQTLAVAT